jgi:outer membrane lipoprotein-sorting protein
MKTVIFILVIFLSLIPGVSHGAKKWGKCNIDTKKIVDSADRIMFAKTTAGKMIMKVKKPGFTSTMKMKFWSKGREKNSVKIYSPSRVKGMSTLKMGKNVWYYMPRTDRIVKVSSSMMGDSWMGSHITNDDLVKQTQLYKHYTCINRKDSKTGYVISLKPKPSAPVVWGKIVMHIQKTGNIPTKTQFYSEKGVLKRTMSFSSVRKMDGKMVPTKMVITPTGKSEYTEITYVKIRFNVSIPSRYFSLRGLKR